MTPNIIAERQGELAEAERAAREKEKEAEMMKEENIRIITHKVKRFPKRRCISMHLLVFF